MEGIQLSVDKAGLQNTISVIKVGGYIDTTTSSELEHALGEILKSESYHIIIDLGNVDYISSAGWGIFISEIKGIREKGGDLKLVKMIPEVYEVFELLEFHYILKSFDTIEDAVEDFEKSGLTRTTSPKLVSVETAPKKSSKARPQKVITPNDAEQSVRPIDHSIEEKVREVVLSNPESSTINIARALNSSKYGHVKIGWFGLRKVLKKLGLDTKRKRLKLTK